ncbi:MAG: sporulation protein YqfD [Peptococcaceae bacterium]
MASLPQRYALYGEGQGVIYGEQERSVIGSCSLEERMLQSTGNIKKQIAGLKGHELILHGPKTSPYPYSCQQIKTTRLLGWQQFELPVYVRTTIFEEKQIEQRSYTKEEAYTMAVERARKRLQEQMPKGSRFIRESAGICPSDQQNVVQAEVVWTIEANLAEVKQTQLPEAELSAEQNEQQTEQAAEGQ